MIHNGRDDSETKGTISVLQSWVDEGVVGQLIVGHTNATGRRHL